MFCWVKCAAAIGLLALLSITACSKSDLPEQASEGANVVLSDPNALNPVPYALVQLQQSADLISQLPPIVTNEALAQSGLQVAYTRELQSESAPALLIEAHWMHMQTCLDQVSVAPLVMILPSSVAPLTADDDVIHSMQGIPVASATLSEIPIIQISLSDFLPSANGVGFNLRSIMGRLLWASSGLAVRDYSYDCAKQAVNYP